MEEILRHSSLHENTHTSKDQLRKTKKPLMEKRRRARINSCLNDIKSLLLQAFNKDGSQFSKLEKADILEMTVKYLRSVQQAQLSAAVHADHAVTTRYRAGFTECAKETLRYVDNVNVSDALRNRLSDHLNSCVQAINTCPPAPITPVYVTIPSYHTEAMNAQPHYIVPQTAPSPSISSDSDFSPVSHSGLLQVPKQEYNALDHNVTTNPSSNDSRYSTSPNFVHSQLCQDVVCTERSHSSTKSPRSCHQVRCVSPAETVWRPW